MDEPYFKKYLAYVDPSIRPIDALEAQASRFLSWCQKVDDAQTLVLHGPYTWTFHQVLNHITDSERVLPFECFGLPGVAKYHFQDSTSMNSRRMRWQTISTGKLSSMNSGPYGRRLFRC